MPPSATTVEEYLLAWVDAQAHHRSAGTVAAYRHKRTSDVIPRIGALRSRSPRGTSMRSTSTCSRQAGGAGRLR